MARTREPQTVTMLSTVAPKCAWAIVAPMTRTASPAPPATSNHGTSAAGSSQTVMGNGCHPAAAATTSVLTILGVAILLSPVLVRTWRDFKGKT